MSDDDTIAAAAQAINALADELPSARRLQELRDKLSEAALEMLEALLNETLP